MRRARSFILLLGASAVIWGCSEDPAARDGGPSGDSIAPTDGGPGGPGLTGTVKDEKGVPVGGAQLEVGSELAYSTDKGLYELTNLNPGPVTVKVTQSWFKDKSVSATVEQSGMTTLNIVIEEHPLTLDPADKTLADTYNQSFDYTKDTISIVVLPRPSRKELDNAIYYRNPALYRDTSSEKDLTPSPQPDIASGSASGFTFQTGGGSEALDLTTIEDKIDDTPLTKDEKVDYLMWRPMMNWLKEQDPSQLTGLANAEGAVNQQTWGDSNAANPQAIEQVFLHGKELWVQVVFEAFVKLGAGVTDSDGDGRVEIYARLAPAQYTDAIVTKLQTDYVQPTFDTHGLSKEVNQSLNELYTTTAAQVEKYIAQPFEVTGLGTITYPFMVLKHSEGQQNVLLVGP